MHVRSLLVGAALLLLATLSAVHAHDKLKLTVGEVTLELGKKEPKGNMDKALFEIDGEGKITASPLIAALVGKNVGTEVEEKGVKVKLEEGGGGGVHMFVDGTKYSVSQEVVTKITEALKPKPKLSETLFKDGLVVKQNEEAKFHLKKAGDKERGDDVLLFKVSKSGDVAGGVGVFQPILKLDTAVKGLKLVKGKEGEEISVMVVDSGDGDHVSVFASKTDSEKLAALGKQEKKAWDETSELYVYKGSEAKFKLTMDGDKGEVVLFKFGDGKFKIAEEFEKVGLSISAKKPDKEPGVTIKVTYNDKTAKISEEDKAKLAPKFMFRQVPAQGVLQPNV